MNPTDVPPLGDVPERRDPSIAIAATERVEKSRSTGPTEQFVGSVTARPPIRPAYVPNAP
jgi:hypothetical protein